MTWGRSRAPLMSLLKVCKLLIWTHPDLLYLPSLINRHFSTFAERKNPPVFTKKPSEQMEDTEGRLVKIEGRVSGSQPMSVSWYKEDAEIHSSDKYDISFKSNVAVLCIKSSLVSDSGRYTCQASNQAGRASCSTTVGISGERLWISYKNKYLENLPRMVTEHISSKIPRM